MINKHHEHLFISHVAALVMAGLVLSLACFWCSINTNSVSVQESMALAMK